MNEREAGATVAPRKLAEVAETLSEFRTALAAGAGSDLLARITELAHSRIAGATSASVTLLERRHQFTTMAATDPMADTVDAIQYRCHEGPCLDTLRTGTPVFVTNELATDMRWPTFGAEAAQLGAGSVLSLRLTLDLEQRVLASLNVYSTDTGAFGDEAVSTGALLAAHAGGVLLASHWQNRVDDLQTALESSREIGMAMGILMNQRRVSREDAFGLLRKASQYGNRKLRDVACHLVATGDLPLPPSGGGPAPNR